MKLNKNSFHSHVYQLMFTKLPNNLCSYFWKALLSFIIILGVAVITFGIFICSNYHLVRSILNLYSYDYNLVKIALILDGLPFIGFLIYLIVIWSERMEDKKLEKIMRGNYQPKKPSIVAEYLKAKKDKYCPKIDWE